MSPIEVLFIILAVAGAGVVACGISIMFSISQRSKPLKRVKPPKA